MPHNKRVCRKQSRVEGMNPNLNYHSRKVYLKMKKKIKAAKLARRRNRRRS